MTDKEKKPEVTWICECGANKSTKEIPYSKCIHCDTKPKPLIPHSHYLTLEKKLEDLETTIRQALEESIPGDLVDEPPSYTERYWFLYKQLKKAIAKIKVEV